MDYNENKTHINWYPGHMVKTKKDLLAQKELVDIVIEVIDGRIPISSRVEEMDKIIGNKKRIIVVTKYDLCDKDITNKIITEYKKTYPVICVNLLDDSVKSIISEIKKLMIEVNEKRLMKGLQKRRARVMIVGTPNVGKSSLINRLVLKKVASVGNKPGVTKNINWIRISPEVELLDSPGVLWPKFEDQNRALKLAACSSIKEEILNRELICEFIIKILYELYPEKLNERYGIKEIDFDNLIDLYDTIGKRRGCLISGGEIDYDRVVDVVIRDFNNGYFKGITLDR